MNIKIKNILKIVVTFMIIFFFIPTFTVSCSGEKKGISAIGVVGGYSSQGYDVSEPQPVVLFLLAIPIAVLVLLFFKDFKDKKNKFLVVILSFINFIAWILLKSGVKEFAEDYNCDFKPRFLYYLIQLLNIVMIVIPLLDAFGIIDVNKNMQNIELSKINVSRISKFQVGGLTWKCSVCGGLLPLDNESCKYCGTKRPEDVVISITEEKKEEQTFIICSACGQKLLKGANFCPGCGNKINE